MTSEYHMAKFSDFFHLSASCVSPFFVVFLSLLTDFFAPAGFGGIFGLSLSPFAGAGGSSPFFPNSSSVGSTPISLRNFMRSAGAMDVDASFRRGCECTLDSFRSDSSTTSVTSFSALFAIESGPTQPFLHPSFSSRIASSAIRRFVLPCRPSIFPSSFVFTAASVAAVTRNRPCFLSRRKRFFVCPSLSPARGTLATSSSAVMQRVWA
mmetsp:Transcript_37956/g.90832  ORF Transcript_37956/g.90832 Transcript_37956/m.90832 type:complete len:209 (-) Transcript_37956:197-823(-)